MSTQHFNKVISISPPISLGSAAKVNGRIQYAPVILSVLCRAAPWQGALISCCLCWLRGNLPLMTRIQEVAERT